MSVAVPAHPSVPRGATPPARRLAVLVGALLLGLMALLLHGVTRADTGPRGITAADGYLDGHPVSAFATGQPAVARLDPGLRSALQRATRGARPAGLTLLINSGWRSRAYQQHLLDEAIKRYGSRQVALRWVDTPAASHHVTGRAVDVGPPAAARWLADHGTAYGLCRVYANEPWHFERLTTPGGACPALRSTAG